MHPGGILGQVLIQGQVLEVTVMGCDKLKDKKWILTQNPYVCLEYGGTKYKTRTHKDGGKNPSFKDKFSINLIQGLQEIDISAWNSNTLYFDDFIGSGKVKLHKVLSQGFDDTAWSLQSKTGRRSGDVCVIMYYANATTHATSYAAPATPLYAQAPAPYQAPYVGPSTPTYPNIYPNSSAYPPQPFPTPAYPPQRTSYYPPPGPSQY